MMKKQRIRSHIVKNIIKVRLYTKKWTKNEILQKEIEKYLEKKQYIIEQLLEIRKELDLNPRKKRRFNEYMMIAWFLPEDKEKIETFMKGGDITMDIMNSVQGYLNLISEMKI